MPNALLGGMPPMPVPQAAPQPMQSPTNALMVPSQQRMPAPSHAMAVAATRHFAAVIKELQKLLKNPDMGKSNMKSQIIDGFSDLVGRRVLSPANAVPELTSAPEEPLLQRKWAQQKLQQAIQASNNVIDHHVATHPGSLDWATEQQHPQSNPDNHMDEMASLSAHYGQ